MDKTTTDNIRFDFENAYPDKDVFEFVDFDYDFVIYIVKPKFIFNPLINVSCLNGAWWAWTTQQKKIEIIEMLRDNQFDKLWSIANVVTDDSLFHENKCEMIQEILK